MTVEALPLPGLPPARCPETARRAHDGLVWWQQRCSLDVDHDGCCFWCWVETPVVEVAAP